MDRKRLTRRQLGMVAAAASATSMAAQQPAAAGDLERARANAKQSSDALRKVKLPQLLEPSFTFRP